MRRLGREGKGGCCRSFFVDTRRYAAHYEGQKRKKGRKRERGSVRVSGVSEKERGGGEEEVERVGT